MPILIITSFYGMNVNHFPTFKWSVWEAYFWVFGVSGAMTAVIYLIMRRRRWL
jgi:Mg2+ and Co2+ transporter CorA